MIRLAPKLIALAAGAAVIWTAVAIGSSLFSEEERPAPQLVNQIWIDRMPDNPRDMVHYFVIVRQPRQRLGLAGKTSHWRTLQDRFLWRLKGDRLRLYFPQEEARWAPNVRTWRCEGEAPRPFDLCLEISDQRHRVLLYSRTDWHLSHGDDAGEHALPDIPGLRDSLGQVLQSAPQSDSHKSDPDIESFREISDREISQWSWID